MHNIVFFVFYCLGQNKVFTILAPTDEAFSLLPGSQFEELKNNPQKRQEFIRQHIIPSRVALSGFRAFDEREVPNANNLTLHVTAYPNGVSLALSHSFPSHLTSIHICFCSKYSNNY